MPPSVLFHIMLFTVYRLLQALLSLSGRQARPFPGMTGGSKCERAASSQGTEEERHKLSLCLTCLFFDDKRYITPYSTKNTHWKIQDISR